MLKTQKKAVPVEELFGYSSKSDKRKKRHKSSESESSSDSEGEYSGSVFTKRSKSKKIFSEEDIEGPVQCKKCFSVIEKPKRKHMMEAYQRCLSKKLCKRCYRQPQSAIYEEISRSIQTKLTYTPVVKKTSTSERRDRLAEVSAVSVATSSSSPVKTLIFTIGATVSNGSARKCIFVNGGDYTHRPIRLHSSVTYDVTVDTDDEPLILTMSPSGGKTAVKLKSTFDPMTSGTYTLTFNSSFPARFFYQSIKTENLGGSITVSND